MQRGLPQPGDIVAEKYVISRLLGRGGMGAVYVVEHRVTGKRLALKCLLPEHLQHPEFIERFLREAQAAGRIQHRNVVDVFDVGREGNLLYIVMELLDGKPLSELLRDGKLTLEETLQILLRAMDGVTAAHAVGIVHRDLKPDNILVCVGQSGRLDDPRVLDFGISKLEDDVSKPLTKSGVMLGTPYYMAFEQINSQRDLDQRVDVYAMGVILYEAMAGQPPYVAESVGALAIRMMSGPPTPLAQLRPELPEGLADVVMRSVARDRDQRYPTMQALMAALKPYVAESASLLTPQGQGTPLGASFRHSQAVEPTLPALRSLAPRQTDSSARLRLHGADSHAGRTPSAETSSRTLLLVGAVALLVIVGAAALYASLRAPDQAPGDGGSAAPVQSAPAADPAASPSGAAAEPKALGESEGDEAEGEQAPGRSSKRRRRSTRSGQAPTTGDPSGADELIEAVDALQAPDERPTPAQGAPAQAAPAPAPAAPAAPPSSATTAPAGADSPAPPAPAAEPPPSAAPEGAAPAAPDPQVPEPRPNQEPPAP